MPTLLVKDLCYVISLTLRGYTRWLTNCKVPRFLGIMSVNHKVLLKSCLKSSMLLLLSSDR